MDKVGRGYRVPKLEEFIQGFEFEQKHTYSFGFIDFENNKFIKGKEFISWLPNKVWWKYPEDDMITTELDNGHTLTQMGRSINFFKPFNEQLFIDQKLVRVKIRRNGE